MSPHFSVCSVLLVSVLQGRLCTEVAHTVAGIPSKPFHTPVGLHVSANVHCLVQPGQVKSDTCCICDKSRTHDKRGKIQSTRTRRVQVGCTWTCARAHVGILMQNAIGIEMNAVKVIASTTVTIGEFDFLNVPRPQITVPAISCRLVYYSLWLANLQSVFRSQFGTCSCDRLFCYYSTPGN